MKKIRVCLWMMFGIFLIAIFSHSVVSETFDVGVKVGVGDRDYSVSVPVVKLVVDEHGSANTPVTIINFGRTQEFDISSYPEFGFISLDENEFTLSEGEEFTFDVLLNAGELEPGVYVGEITISAEESVLIPVILEVQTPSPFFDISTGVSQNSPVVEPGGEFVADVVLHRLRGPSNDVILQYALVSTKGEVLASGEDLLSVSDRVEIRKTFFIPENTEFGDYVFFVNAKYAEFLSVGTSSLIVPVTSIGLSPTERDFSNYYFSIVGFIVLILVVSFVAFNYFWNKRLVDNVKYWDKKLTDIKKIKFSDTGREIRKLESRKRVLEQAYEKGYIKGTSYTQASRKINEIILQLKKRL